AARGTPSTRRERAQRAAAGVATPAAQMAAFGRRAGVAPAPDRLAGPPPAGARVAGVISPHDDYVYAGRVYRAILPHVQARRVILIGVFHGWRRFDARDRLVFDTYRTWRTPDGPVPVSPLRDELVARLPAGTRVSSAPMHDSEHSVEAIVYWLRHQRPDLEIVPILVPVMGEARMREVADSLGRALAARMRRHGWALGRDLQIVISADAVHYGADFKHTPFGPGGEDAYARAVANDQRVLQSLAGSVTDERAHLALEAFTDPADPARYRLTWCGRFSIPFGMMLVHRVARALGESGVDLRPVAHATSVSAPPLPVRTPGLGVTAPATLQHFVGYAAAAFVLPPRSR
ncbi:MAG: AmmeMemoRadiSam system protein B, partial [Deltaproteobacteria bacterium]|nr:AmmeMemoRadiSam system protein B [Deltaproteobacteria bacterium]